MSWFLVLLFWNPQIEEYVGFDRWPPKPYATYAMCDKVLQYVDRYLLDDAFTVSDCIQSKDAQTAILTLKR